jgi:hypothetical protein
MDAQLLFGNCSVVGSFPILPNTTNGPICSVEQSISNDTAFQACCNRPTRSYGCFSYCSVPSAGRDFVQCLQDRNASDNFITQTFCYEGLAVNNTAGNATTSGAFRSKSAPNMSLLVILGLLAFFFIGPADATIIPSLSPSLSRRQNPGDCTITADRNWTTIRNTMKVSPTFGCNSDRICPFEVDVNTGINENNRTLNGTSAADAQYNAFFDVLANSTGRLFPAMSSLEVRYSWSVLSGGQAYIGWTPFAVCAN